MMDPEIGRSQVFLAALPLAGTVACSLPAQGSTDAETELKLWASWKTSKEERMADHLHTIHGTMLHLFMICHPPGC